MKPHKRNNAPFKYEKNVYQREMMCAVLHCSSTRAINYTNRDPSGFLSHSLLTGQINDKNTQINNHMLPVIMFSHKIQ